MITSKKIKEYRLAMKKLGLWEKDFRSIDIAGALSRARSQDYYYDIVGGFFEQMIVASKLLTYGNSEHEMSDKDLEILFAPLEPFDELRFTPYLFSNNIDLVLNNLFPLFFSIMKDSDNMKNFESVMRGLLCSSSDISTSALGFGIALGVCFRKYDGMSEHLSELRDRLERMLDKLDRYEELKHSLDISQQKNTLARDYFLFSGLLSTAIVECNMHAHINGEQMMSYMDYMNRIIDKNKDMRAFVDSEEFKLLMRGIEGYHEFKKEKK